VVTTLRKRTVARENSIAVSLFDVLDLLSRQMWPVEWNFVAAHRSTALVGCPAAAEIGARRAMDASRQTSNASRRAGTVSREFGLLGKIMKPTLS
jgi:hypothetical protein